MGSTRKTSVSKLRAARRRSAGPAVAGVHLLSDAEMRRIAERVFKFSDADETEVEIGAITDALTRFANNTIHQNVAEQSLAVSVRTVLDGRTARATTNKTDDDSLRRVVETAKSLARSQPRDPDLLPMPGPQKYTKAARYFENTAYATPADRARAVARVAEMAEKNKQTAAGIFSTGVTQSAIANTRGLFASHRQTRAEFSITILESDSSGWAKANSPDLARINPTAMARSASEKSAASRKPVAAAPGRWTVILEPSAVLDLVGFLFYDFSGTAMADQRSCFNKRMGKRVLGENITLHDDAYHPLQSGAALRRRRDSAPENSAGGQRRPHKSGVLARQRQKNESQANRPRLFLAQRYGRGADEFSFRWGQIVGGRNGAFYRARHPGHATLVYT